MPRLVRRQSLCARLLSYLNPLDLALDLYTYIGSYDWDGVQSTTSTPIGIGLNLLLFLCRVNCSTSRSDYTGDILAGSYDGKRGPTWRGLGSAGKVGYFLWIFSWILAGISVLNAILCFTKKKRYRMFESNIDIEPSTPSARRVRVDSSPSTITTVLSPKQKAREDYNSTTDVWEISVWDPSAISLRLFSLFSPVHCAIYFLIFPLATATSHVFPPPTSNTPTYLTVVVIQLLLSLQLGQLTRAFAQQNMDKAVIQKEVFREYDSKYVHPRLHMLKRDVATQTMDDHFEASVDVFTPVFNRMGFVTRPNPNYKHYTAQTETPGGYTSTFATPQVERQLKREQQQHHGGTLFNRLKEEDETPIKSEYRGRSSRFNAAGASAGGLFTSNIDREKERERRERVQRGLDAFSTIYPDLDENNDITADTQDPRPVKSRPTNALANPSPRLQPKSQSNEDDMLSSVSERRPTRISGDLGTPVRPVYRSAGLNTNTGMAGLVNMSLENSRSLSPSKVNSPMKRGTRARGSSYAASLGGGVFGTPKR